MTVTQCVFMCIYIYLLYDYSCSQSMQFSACLKHLLPKYLIPHLSYCVELTWRKPCQGYH